MTVTRLDTWYILYAVYLILSLLRVSKTLSLQCAWDCPWLGVLCNTHWWRYCVAHLGWWGLGQLSVAWGVFYMVPPMTSLSLEQRWQLLVLYVWLRVKDKKTACWAQRRLPQVSAGTGTAKGWLCFLSSALRARWICFFRPCHIKRTKTHLSVFSGCYTRRWV